MSRQYLACQHAFSKVIIDKVGSAESARRCKTKRENTKNCDSNREDDRTRFENYNLLRLNTGLHYNGSYNESYLVNYNIFVWRFKNRFQKTVKEC